MAAKKKGAAGVYNMTNLGLKLLLGLMGFEIVLLDDWHIYTASTGFLGWLYYLKDISIPVFVILCFYCSEHKLKSSNGKEIWDAILRLVIPILGWGLIYFLFYLVLQETLCPGYSLRGKDLLDLILFGNSTIINSCLWVYTDELLLTLGFMLIILVAQKFHNVLFIILMAVCLVMEYMGVTICQNQRTEIAICIGELPEMLPIAVVGFLLAYYAFTEKTRNWWPVTMLVSVIVICLLRYYGIFTDIEGLGYAGVKRIVLAAALVLLFAAPPLAKLPNFVHVIVDWLTRYALGIFCMHRLVTKLLEYFITHREWIDFETDTLTESIIVYLICYVICLLVSLIPCKWTRMLVQND